MDKFEFASLVIYFNWFEFYIERGGSTLETIIIVGPSGVGKSPLDALFKVDVKIDPYRLRSRGPRDFNDIFYAHPKLYDELHSVLEKLNDKPKIKNGVEWFPKSEILFFKVREEWQLLILAGLNNNEENNNKERLAKAEIYAPVLPVILSIQEIRNLLGEIHIIVLNPANQSIIEMQDLRELELKTYYNCIERGDYPISLEKCVKSIREEMPAWIKLIEDYAATEYWPWKYPEYLYKTPDEGTTLLEHQKHILKETRECLLEKNPDLSTFLKTDDEIDRIAKPFVK